MVGKKTQNLDGRDENFTLSFEEIYTRNFRRIFSFMSARLSERETARDLAVEVFVRFLKTRPSVIRKNVPSYLYGIAKKVLADYRRDKKRIATEEHSVDLEKLPAPEALDIVDIFALKEGIKQLEVVDREILNLRFWNDESHKEIAKHLGMSPIQVRQRFHRALKRLRKLLDEL